MNARHQAAAPLPASASRSVAIDPASAVAIAALYADYAAALDDRRFDDWLDFFTEDAVYRVQPRGNFERGLPLATMSLEGQGMRRDRIHAVVETLFHAPYRQRQVIGAPRVLALLEGSSSAPTRLRTEAAYSVFRTHLHEPTEVLSVGRHLDELVLEAGAWRFARKTVVFDSELIPNSLIYPL